MNLVDAVRVYFGAERSLGFALVVAGVLAIAATYFVWRTQGGSFAVGLAIPALLFALGGTIGGAFLERRSNDQLERFTIEARERPTELASIETARMAKVNANWPRIKPTWAVLCAIGFALVLATKREGAHGFGLALVVIAAGLLIVDVFAERRAYVYSAALAAQR